MKRVRAIATLLVISMVASLVGCKKTKKTELIESIKYKSGQVVQETDPFFDAEVNLIKLPIEEGREVEDIYLLPYGFVGNLALVEYHISYKMPESINYETMEPEEYEEEASKYYISGIGVFDAAGNYIKDIPKEITYVYDVATDPDGHLCIMGHGPDEKDPWKSVLIVAVIDNDGKISKKIVLKGAPFDPRTMYVPKLGFLSDGSYSVRDQSALFVFGKDGQLRYTVSDPERTLGTGIVTQNGKSYVLSFAYDYEGTQNIQIKEVNIKTGELGKSTDVSGLSAFGELYPTAERLYVISSTGCYEYDIEAGKLSKFFDWSDTDVNRSIMKYARWGMTPTSMDEIFTIGLNGATNPVSYYLIHLTRAKKNPHAGKTMILVGGMDIANNKTLMTAISEYNSNPENKSRAVLVDYTEDLEKGTSRAEIEDKVLLDIRSGDGPDILVNFAESSAFQKTEVMEDLNPYMDGPNGISRDAYFDNVFRAQEKDGQLFHAPVRFAMDGLLANTKYISNKIGWTFDEFSEAALKMPDNVGFSEGILCKDFLAMILRSTMMSFVDYKNKTCDFQNDTMKKYLQLARQFGVDKIAEDEGMEMYYVGNALKEDTNFSENKYNSELIALRKITIEVLLDYGEATHSPYYPIPSVFLGYPSSDGSGPVIRSGLSIGIVATSKYKDLSWDFLRSILEFQGGENFFDRPLAINKELFEKECVGSIGPHTYANEQDLAELREIIESSRTTLCYDAAMLDVITEEAAAYFAGDRSEDDVLKNIQNRCSLIVKERG